MLRVVTPPTVEPVSLAEARSHLRLETTLDDSTVLTLITAARQHVEATCWRGIMQQTLELALPAFRGEDRLELTPDWSAGVSDGATWMATSYSAYRYRPFVELIGGHLAETPAVVATYTDVNGAPQTWSSSEYLVQNTGNDRQLGRLWPNAGAGFTWPTTFSRFDAAKVQYAVGYATAAKVPAGLKQCILLLVAQMYEQRTPQVTGTIVSDVGLSYDALLEPYRFSRL